MSTHLNDQEQVEFLKRLWKKFGNWILVIIVLIALAIAGWRFYNSHHRAEIANASAAYQIVVASILSGKSDLATIQAQAQHVMTQYDNTGYATLAALLLAGENVKAGKLDQAKTNLQWALQHTDNAQYHAIAAVRLARVEIAQGNAKQALALLVNPPKGFQVAYDVARGDAYTALEQMEQARASYQQALRLLPKTDPYREVILTYLSGLPS